MCLGDVHSEVESSISISQALERLAEPGDIVLVEAFPQGEVISAKSTAFTQGLPPDVRVMGWDDTELADQTIANIRKLIDIRGAIKKADGAERDRLEAEFWNLKKKTDRLSVVKRNKFLMKALDETKVDNSIPRVFVIAGTRHFRHPEMKKYLQRSKYLVFVPQVQKDTRRGIAYFREDAEQDQSRVFTVELPNGSKRLLGEDWFINGKAAQLGDEMTLDPATGGQNDKADLKKEGFEYGRKYRILRVD